jgi:CelD/BcsL family acetyltransferase involved in cellulose biosynthesis
MMQRNYNERTSLSIVRPESATSLAELDVLQQPACALSVEVVTDYQVFLELEPAWNQLVEEASVEFPFIRHEWIRAIWECFDHGGTFKIIMVWEGKASV